MKTAPHVTATLDRLEGILLIPHELLHVAAYRLIGKGCQYRLGAPFVQRAASITRAERLFVLLFPTAIAGGAAVVFFLLWAFTAFALAARDPLYPFHAPAWHIGLGVSFAITAVYAASGAGDIIAAARLLRDAKEGIDQPPDSSDQ